MFQLQLYSLSLVLVSSSFKPAKGRLIPLDYELIPRNTSNLYGLDTSLDETPLYCTNEGGYRVRKGSTDRLIQLWDNQEYVLGTNKSVYFDEDWGMFSAVLASYNNHWVLRTTPEDWWTVATRRIAQALDEHGDEENVRAFFVDHQGKKKIDINVGPSLSNIDYSWLFDQFSSKVRENINKPRYVDIVQADFSATTDEQRIISQVMLMSSVKKYFTFGITTACGIPGVDLIGTDADWSKLLNKLIDLDILLKPIQKDLDLKIWFSTTRRVFSNILDTYRGKSNTAWWGRILSWNQGGSGVRDHWSGWFPYFLGANAAPPNAEGNNALYFDNRKPADPADFPSGLVSVPLQITDKNNRPPLQGEGLLVAGTLGFTVEDGRKFPSVQPNQVWGLLLPTNSKLKQRFLG